MDQLFSLCPLDYFSNGNSYTGSAEHLRYLVSPKNDQLEVSVWCEDVCLSLAKIRATESFAQTEEGLEQMRNWLTNQYHQLYR